MEQSGDAGPQPPPQPERAEPELGDPGIRDLSARDWKAIVVRAGKEAKNDNVTDIAAALAYYAFLAIPALLLVAVGVFTLTAGTDTIESMMRRLEGVVPEEAITLLRDSLTRAIENQSGGLALIIVRLPARALDGDRGDERADARPERGLRPRRDARLRQAAAHRRSGCSFFLLLAFALSFGVLVLGPVIADWLGGLLDLESVFGWLWWTLQWPIMLLGLLFAFAWILYLGPNVDHPRWRFLTLGAVVAVVVWLLASGLFALYVSMFSSYNKAWGSLAAVIIMLTWLWLSALALLFGAEVNAEAERSRELRQGKPAESDLQAPAKA